MDLENDNQKQLTDFFTDEYQSLKRYVTSHIDKSIDSDAEDIVQDVALKLFSRNGTSPIDNIAGFVYRSIKNRIIDIMRNKKVSVYDEPQLEDLWMDFTELFYGKNAYEYPEKLKRNLQEAIAKLKPIYRDIIIAVDFEGYTYREIAERTGIPPGTLMSQRHRALSILNKKLELKKQEL